MPCLFTPNLQLILFISQINDVCIACFISLCVNEFFGKILKLPKEDTIKDYLLILTMIY